MQSSTESNLQTKKQLAKTELIADKVLSEHSFYEFFKCAWHVLHPSEALIDNWHIKELCDLLQAETVRIKAGKKKKQDILINIPPRSLKSMIVTIMWNAWAWLEYTEMKFITASYSAGLAADHSGMTKMVIESQWYQFLWPEIELRHDSRAITKYANTKLGSRRATSVGGTVTGAGCDVLIGDDVINPKKAMSIRERTNCIDWWTRTMYNRLNNPEVGLRVIVMQRLHEEDLTGHILAKKMNYKHICIPAEVTEDLNPPSLKKFYKKGLFFPDRFTREILDEYNYEMGSFGYAGQYLQQPSPEGGGIVRTAWFKKFSLLKLEDKAKELGKTLVWNFVIDTAYTKDETNDPTAVMCYAEFDGETYIRGVNSAFLEFPELVEWLPSYVTEQGYDGNSRIYIEPKASGKSVVQQLKRDTRLNIIEDKPPRDDKIVRLNSISATIQAGKVHLLEHATWLDKFLHEVAAFPRGKHDDQVDCLSMAVSRAISKSNSVTAFAVMGR